jgi:hypothetical protein
MQENITDFFGELSNRTLTVRTSKGHPLIHVRLVHAAGVAAAGVIMAPRLTAVATLGLLFKGFSLSLDPLPESRR